MKISTTRSLATRGGQLLPFTPLGFGAAQIGNMGRKLADDDARETIRTAWDRDVRYFDTAPLYGLGLSERRVGAALRAEARDSYLLSTKVGMLVDQERTATDEGVGETAYAAESRHYDYSYGAIMRSVEMSLERLALSRIDILLVHDIDPQTHGADGSDAHLRALIDGGGWRALDELRRNGVVRALGAGLGSWESSEQLLNLVDPDIFLLAGRYTLLEQESLARFLPACVRRGVGVVVGGPFNSGILATGPIAQARYEYGPAPLWALERARALEAVCGRHGVSLAQAALQFPLGHPAVVSVVVGSYTADEVDRNAALMARETPQDLWAELKASGLLRADAPTPGPDA